MTDMLKHFGLEADPFLDPEPFESADVKDVRARIDRALKNREWLLVAGPPGSGKTFAVREALAASDCRLVRTLGGNRKWYRVNNLDQAVFEDLTDEPPRNSREARRRQMERIMGEISRETPICILLDEATQLPRQTFSEIKHMRESLHYGSDPRNARKPDFRPLFSVVMIGWPSLQDQVERSAELRPRVRRKRMDGLAPSEVRRFVAHLGLERVCPKPVCDALAEGARYPLAIVDRLQDALERAYARGDKTISVEDVAMNVTDLWRIVQRMGCRIKDVAEAIGASTSQTHAILTGAAGGSAKAQRQMADANSFLQQKLAEAGGEAAAAVKAG